MHHAAWYGRRMSTSRAEWLAARKGSQAQPTIGSSEAAAILGWSRFDDRYSLWHRKLGLVAEDDDSDERRDAGTFLERGILEWYTQRTDRMLLLPDMIGELLAGTCEEHESEMWHELRAELLQYFDLAYGPDDAGRIVLRSREYPWLALSPDALVCDDAKGWGFVDAKNIENAYGWKQGDSAPAEYSAQIAHATLCTGFRWGGFAVCVGGQRLLVVDVDRSEMVEIEDLLRDEVPAFVRSLGDHYPPPPSGSAASLATLRKLFPAHEEVKAVGWVGEIEACGLKWAPAEWAQAYDDAVAQRKAWIDKARDLEVVLRHVAGDAGKVVMPGGVSYTIRTAKDGSERIRRHGR